MDHSRRKKRQKKTPSSTTRKPTSHRRRHREPSPIPSESESESDDAVLMDDELSDLGGDVQEPMVIAGFGDDEEEEEEEELDVERDARLLDEQIAVDEAADVDEARAALIEEGRYLLPTDEELEAEKETPTDPSTLKTRIQGVVGALSDFAARRDPNRKRGDYLSQLTGDLAAYYSYSQWLVGQFLKLFPPAEVVELMEANDTPRPITIRANTLKARRKDVARELIARGVNLDPLAKWCKVGLQVFSSTVPIGATPEYLAGHYMLQSASSFLPVLALEPSDGETVLDMSAAPGGKTTYIAAEMRNTGVVIANDPSQDRCKALAANCSRLGCRNVVVTSFDGREIPHSIGIKFDRVLLDAPCTGTGVLGRDPVAKLSKGLSDLQRCQHLQKELILAAIDALDHRREGGGVLVYSTCSVMVEENEEVVDYALKMRPVRVVPSGLELGIPGFTKYRGHRFHPSLSHARRVYPHVHNMDGFFVCKLVTYVPAKPETKPAPLTTETQKKKKKKR